MTALASRASSVSWLQRPVAWRPRKIRTQDVAWLMRQLAITERAGLPIKRALDTLGDQRRGTPTGVLIDCVRGRLDAGDDLATAFDSPDLGRVATALIAAGATSGSMAATFEKLADMTDERVELQRKVRGALTYPAVVGALSALLTIGMLVFVVPTFRGLYAQLNGRLPWPTRALLAVSSAVRRGAIVGAIAVAATVVLFRRWRTEPAHAATLDLLECRIPLVGRLLSRAGLSRIATTFAGLLEAGVTTLVAIDIAADAAGLIHLAASLRAVGDHIRQGSSISDALGADPIWPPVMVQLTHVGEETGQVSELLRRYADVTRQEVSTEINRLVNLIEPLMVVVIGTIIGATVVCLYLPLFDLINLVK